MLFAFLVAALSSPTFARSRRYGWFNGTSTYYGGNDASGTLSGGACGYGNILQYGYTVMNAASSPSLYQNGFGCGACYQIECVNDAWSQGWCYPGYVVVTVTNQCPATPQNPLCAVPHAHHLDLSYPAFTQLAPDRAGQIHTRVRRVKCNTNGDIQFTLSGNPYWLQLLVTNVGGAGTVDEVWVQGNGGPWQKMDHSLGALFSLSGQAFGGMSLSFKVRSHLTKQWIYAQNVAPSSWNIGQTFSGGQFSTGGASLRRRRRRKTLELWGGSADDVQTAPEVGDDVMPLLDEDSPDEGVWDPAEWEREAGTFDKPAIVAQGTGEVVMTSEAVEGEVTTS